MNPIKLIVPALVMIVSSCSQNTTKTNDGKTDSVMTVSGNDGVSGNEQVSKVISAKLQIKDAIKTGEPVVLKFTVYNQADTAQQFCKWHTPFEPLMSKYLDVKNEKGEEVAYKGAMAKRIMPPPADSYIKVNPKDSLTADVDLLKGYDLQKPGKYTISYSGQNMSGLIVKDSVSFVYKP